MPQNIDVNEVVRQPFAAGAFGALVALRFAVPGSSWPARLFNVAAGALCAGYGAPALAEWMHVVGPVGQAALAFVVGMFGLSVAAAVMQGIRETPLGQIIAGWLRRGQQ